MSEFSPFWAETRDMKPATTTSRIKAGVAGDPYRKHFCPHCARRRVSEANRPQRGRLLGRRCASSYGGILRGCEVGSKTERCYHFCGPYPQTLTATTKNQGSPPGKEPILSKKEKFALYLTPEKKAVLERRYRED